MPKTQQASHNNDGSYLIHIRRLDTQLHKYKHKPTAEMHNNLKTVHQTVSSHMYLFCINGNETTKL